MNEIINKVAESGIITIDIESYLPQDTDVVSFDLKDYLFMGLILKEKDFREALKKIDTSVFKDKIIALHCSVDAIIPVWAYMLAVVTLKPVCHQIVMGSREAVIEKVLFDNIRNINTETFADKRIVIKGCGETPIPDEAYMLITDCLLPYAKSIMYGEPCSTVPVYKRKDSA